MSDNTDLLAAAERMIGLLINDGDPPSLAIPAEFEDDPSAFIEAYENLSAAIVAAKSAM